MDGGKTQQKPKKKKKKKKQDLGLVSYGLAGGIERLKAAQDLAGLERDSQKLSLASPKGSCMAGGLKRHRTSALSTVHFAATAPHRVTVELLASSVFFRISASGNYSLSLSPTLTLTQSLYFSLSLSLLNVHLLRLLFNLFYLFYLLWPLSL